MAAFGKLINFTSTYLIYALVLFLPLIFTNLTTEYFETAKLVFLSIVSLLLLLLWAGRAYINNKLTVVKTPLDILFLLLLLTGVLSTFLSPTPYPALYGLLPKVHGSLIFIIIMVLTFFMVTSNIASRKQLQMIFNLIVVSGLVLSVISILSYFHIFLPWKSAQINNFSLAGSPISAAVFLTITLPLALNMALSEKRLERFGPLSVIGVIASLLSVITIVLIGNISVWLGALAAVALTAWYHKPHIREGGVTGEIGVFGTVLGLIGVIALAVAILSYTPTLKNKTELGRFSAGFVREPQLDLLSSWKISASAFRDSPILGTGPGTYLYNFTQYKPLDFNKTPNWNLKLNSAHNQYLQTWSELGGIGVLLLLIISLTFILMVVRNLKGADPYILGLGTSGIMFALMMALSPMSVLTQITGVILMALFITTLRERHQSVRLMEVNLSTGYGGVHPLIPSIVFVPVLLLALVGFFYLGKLSLGEYYHRQFLNIANNKPTEARNFLIQAETVNSQIDLYRVNLSQTNFAFANTIASQKGPTEASPGGSLTADDKANIQQLLQQAIGEGRAAVTFAPRSSSNWQILANIYRQISGVAPNAMQFALDSYGKAIQQDPLNPELRFEVGSLYYSNKNYDLAVRFFDDSVALKPDFTNGLYNLALALREKGNTPDAIKVAENLVAKLQEKEESEDYKKAARLLSELKEKQASLTTPTPPTSLLEQSDLPKVDIGTPEKVATPPAVQP